MLNPFASDFKPFTAESSLPQKKQEDPPKKKTDAKKRPAQQSTKTKKTHVNSETQVKSNSSSKSNKKKDSQANSNNNTKSQKGKSRRKSSHQDVLAPSITDQFSQEAQFIAIEAAIDPVHRIDPHSSSNVHSSNRRTSLATEHKFEHGYERYIDWIDRSLRLYDTVTVVGMDKAIVDVVSLVTILYDRKLGAHDDIETFTMNPGNGKFTSCIQVKLHPYSAYISIGGF